METKDIIAGYKAWRDNGANEISLTPEQVYTLLWNWPDFHSENPETGYSYGDNRPMGEFFKALSFDGVLKEPEPEAPAKPAYLPVKRKVRVEDLEVGCVLRYCGTDEHGPLVPDIGALVKVTEVYGSGFSTEASGNSSGGSWSGPHGWEFVSNPNYAHGFRIGERVYVTCARHSGWNEKELRVSHAHADAAGVWCNDSRVWFYAKDLTTDPTKAYGYKAPVEYKVKDGVAKEGDVIWWLANYGDPERVIVGGLNWDTNKDNVKGYPEAYQLREPQKVWDYKNK